MLAILLGILKVLLYIILFIILIVVLCILTVLFVPIRYSVEGEKYDAIKLDVKVSFLLHILSFKYHMEDKTNISFKIFGKDILNKKKKEKKVKSKKRPKKNSTKKKKRQQPEDKENKICNSNINKENDNDGCVIKTEIEIRENEADIKNDIGDETDKQETEKIKAEEDKKTKFSDRVKSKSEELDKKKNHKKNKIKKHKIKRHKKEHNKNKSSENKKNIKHIFNTVKDFIKNEENRAVIKMIKDKILKMIKHILPKKFMAKLIIGTGDPASTGYVVGAVSILYTVTGNKLKVIPDFNEKIIQGSFSGKGKIYLIVLLKNTLSIVLDKRVRKLYKAYKA